MPPGAGIAEERSRPKQCFFCSFPRSVSGSLKELLYIAPPTNYRRGEGAVNYPAFADGASPPRDLPLLGATSIPLYPRRSFHRMEPFCNAPCGRGVTEGLLSTGISSPSPEGTTSALTGEAYICILFTTIKYIYKEVIRPLGRGLSPP